MPKPDVKEGMIRVGELARLADVSPRTIRFYVNEGLLPEPLRIHRNMAYYEEKCVAMIRAIKKAQNERFLPLTTIKNMLEANGYDYEALNLQEVPAPARPEMGGDIKPPRKTSLPKGILKQLKTRGWVQTKSTSPESGPGAGGPFLEFLVHCQAKGLEWGEMIDAFQRIQELTEQAVEVEFSAILSRLTYEHQTDYDRLMDWERQVVKEFFNRTRENALNRMIRHHIRLQDNAFLAIRDEGFGIPYAEIQSDLERLAVRAESEPFDANPFIDLAVGYSCVGDLDQAIEILNRVLSREPENVDAAVRLFWYRRLSYADPDGRSGRDELAELVNRHPDSVMGRVFLANCLLREAVETEDVAESLNRINQCLNHFEYLQNNRPDDVHLWTLVGYATGILFTYQLPSMGEQDRGIAALEEVLDRREEIDRYYAERMPFFTKWIWPNLYWFLGSAYLEADRPEEALASFQEAKQFKVSPLFAEKVNTAMEAAEVRKALAPKQATAGGC